MIERILKKMGIPEEPLDIIQFQNAEGGEPYRVWKIEFPGKTLVLKEAKGVEAEIYSNFFRDASVAAPRLLGTLTEENREYLLMEYIPGEDLCRCTRESLTLTLDTLIAMQRTYWDGINLAQAGTTYDRSLPGRQIRREYLKDEKLEQVYDAFLLEYAKVPRTLCHDDLLPFNVLCDGQRAVFIDWECGGILPYPVSLARLIAHGEERADAFFFMKEEDKKYAVEYYFERFIRGKQISRSDYHRTIVLFVFYELCEWIYLGNRYGDTGSARFRDYMAKAQHLADRLLPLL